MRYNSSLPSAEKQQREIAKFYVMERTWTTTANASSLYLDLSTVLTHSAKDTSDTERKIKLI